MGEGQNEKANGFYDGGEAENVGGKATLPFEVLRLELTSLAVFLHARRW